MKIYKKLIAVVVCAAMCLTAFAFNASPVKAEESEQNNSGTAIVSIEAFVLGLGFIAEPTPVAIEEGDTVAAITLKLLDQLGIEADYKETQYGFNLNGIACEGLENCAPTDVPDFLYPELEENYGCMDDETGGWYFPDNGDGMLSAFDFTYYSGWMFADNGEDPGIGASSILAQNGHVYRWMFTIYGYGMDIGLSDGFGMFKPFENPCVGVNRDEAYKYMADIAEIEEYAEKIAEGGYAEKAYKEFLKVLTDLSSSQEEIDIAIANLHQALAGYLGDANVDASVTITDAILILRHALGVYELEGEGLRLADVNLDATVDILDAILAVRIAAAA